MNPNSTMTEFESFMKSYYGAKLCQTILYKSVKGEYDEFWVQRLWRAWCAAITHASDFYDKYIDWDAVKTGETIDEFENRIKV